MTLDIAMQKYYNIIRSYVIGKTGKTDFADECCNAVFFLFSLKEDKIVDEAVSTWLFKTTRNKLKEYYRKKAKDSIITNLDDVTDMLSDGSPDLSDIIVSDEDIDEAKEKLLSLLSPKERQLYEDYFINKMMFIEIAEKLGIDRNTASARVKRIRAKLEAEV